MNINSEIINVNSGSARIHQNNVDDNSITDNKHNDNNIDDYVDNINVVADQTDLGTGSQFPTMSFMIK